MLIWFLYKRKVWIVLYIIFIKILYLSIALLADHMSICSFYYNSTQDNLIIWMYRVLTATKYSIWKRCSLEKYLTPLSQIQINQHILKYFHTSWLLPPPPPSVAWSTDSITLFFQPFYQVSLSFYSSVVEKQLLMMTLHTAGFWVPLFTT